MKQMLLIRTQHTEHANVRGSANYQDFIAGDINCVKENLSR